MIRKLTRSKVFYILAWILGAEILTFAVMLLYVFNQTELETSVFSYRGLVSEGPGKIICVDTKERWDFGQVRKVYQLKVYTILDEKGYYFYLDAKDVLGENSASLAKEAVQKLQIFHGTIFSKDNRETLFFSPNVSDVNGYVRKKIWECFVIYYYAMSFFRFLIYLGWGVVMLITYAIVRRNLSWQDCRQKQDSELERELSGYERYVNPTPISCYETSCIFAPDVTRAFYQMHHDQQPEQELESGICEFLWGEDNQEYYRKRLKFDKTIYVVAKVCLYLLTCALICVLCQLLKSISAITVIAICILLNSLRDYVVRSFADKYKARYGLFNFDLYFPKSNVIWNVIMILFILDQVAGTRLIDEDGSRFSLIMTLFEIIF